ncbi:MAG: hypothetical protein QOD04_69, partial [Pseudonocardiales bacterium]|nr:hypothetical protein [Pseudonocardiales bacterium]
MRTLLTVVGVGLLLAGCSAGTGAGTGTGPGATPAPGAGHSAGGRADACSPSVSIDSFSDALDKTTFDGTYVGNLSSQDVDPDGSIAALSDRSSLFTLDARTHRPT